MLGNYFMGRYFGPFFEDPANTGVSTEGTAPENTLEYWKKQVDVLKTKVEQDAATHAKAYNTLQSNLSIKDNEFKTLKTQFEETSSLMTTLTGEKTTFETNAKALAEERKQLALKLARTQLFLSPDYNHLIEFENQGVIAQVEAWNEDGTPNVDAIKETLDKFSKIYLGSQDKARKDFKQGEVPNGPPPEAKVQPSSVILAEAQKLQREGKVAEFQAKMADYRKAKEAEDKAH